MNDDLIGKVAEAIALGDVSRNYTDEARAAVAAHTDYLLALGGVSREAVLATCVGTPSEKEAKTKTLIARAVAQAVADKDAEIAKWTENALDRQDKWMAAEAKVARVEALLDRVANVPNNVGSSGWGYRAYIDPDDLRAALADEDGAA